MTDSVLVTGASVGFGKEIALLLAERGFTVYATMRHLDRRGPLEEEAARRGVSVRIRRLDVTDRPSIEETVQSIVDETGGVYAAVNNAGLFLRGFFEDLTDEEIRRVFETNLFGAMAVTRAVLPHMRAAGRGRIVVISSVAGRIGSPSGSIYSASRFAQEGFAEALRQEVEPLGIYVSLVEPGITKTESWTIDKGAGVRARDPNSPYYPWFKRAEELFDQAMRSSPITTRDVAEAVYRAITDRRPRWRYMVGWRARIVIGLRRYVPEELFNRLYFGEVMRRVTGGARGT
ncbi:MAG TPA: SDR family NAD(P)-dependent oxidoreductase [Caldilineae bacterium]|nr:SDR family NAD(P)-dependent oxidoreductase [Caldilineae bacterium]